MSDTTPNRIKDLCERLDEAPAWARELSAKLDRVLAELERLNAAGPQAQTAPLTHPAFCGYRCSWDIDDVGWPSYIHLEDGSLASHREKQGHHWYSVSLGDGKYGEHYLKFHRAAPPEGMLLMPQPAPLDEAQAPAPTTEETPFGQADEASLRVMHQLGRALHGEDWPKSTASSRCCARSRKRPHDLDRHHCHHYNKPAPNPRPRIPPARHPGTQVDPRLRPQHGCRQGCPQTNPDRGARRPDVRYGTLQGVETSGLGWAAK